MKEACDLFFLRACNSTELRFVSIFDKSFFYEEGKSYSGYIGANLDRIRAAHLVSRLKAAGCKVMNLPVRYRDTTQLSEDAAYLKAAEHASSRGFEVSRSSVDQHPFNPLLWSFDIINDPLGRAGGAVMIDKVDGHAWELSEYEEFMYDYNNEFI